MVGTNELVPTNSGVIVYPQEMGGRWMDVWLGISNTFGCNFESLGDGWEMAGRWFGRTPVVLEHPIQHIINPSTTTIQYK